MGLNSLKPKTFLGIVPKLSQTKFHHIRISKSKDIFFKFQYQNQRKRKSRKKYSGLQNEATRGIQIREGFIGARGIINWSKRDYKLGHL